MLNCISREFLSAHDRIWMRVMAHLVLNRKEREYWQKLDGTDKRRMEWLLGRTAAKDAVRLFVKKYQGLDLYPADIEIGNEKNGRPIIGSIKGQRDGSGLSLSISHSSGIAFAAAGNVESGKGIGVDIERLRPLQEGFDQTVFNEEERNLIVHHPDSETNEWSLRLWCAKEAVSKALGTGLVGIPKDLTAKGINTETGDIEIEISGQTAAQVSNLPNNKALVRTLQEDNFIIAISLL
jgi:phosphopantetheine--protein transferase-like protein